MSKEIFDHISPGKRERILHAAAGLFAERGFARADVGEIAQRAGVAKGSLYNYFHSKEDIYLSACMDGLDRSRSAVYDGIQSEWDIYRQIDHIFRQGVSFALDHPEYVRLYLNNSSAGMERFAGRLTREVEKQTSDHLKKLIGEGKARGIVRRDIDADLTAYLINSLYIMFVVSLISRHFQIRMREYLGIEGELNGANVEHHLTMLIDMIRKFLLPAGSTAGE